MSGNALPLPFDVIIRPVNKVEHDDVEDQGTSQHRRASNILDARAFLKHAFDTFLVGYIFFIPVQELGSTQHINIPVPRPTPYLIVVASRKQLFPRMPKL